MDGGEEVKNKGGTGYTRDINISIIISFPIISRFLRLCAIFEWLTDCLVFTMEFSFPLEYLRIDL